MLLNCCLLLLELYVVIHRKPTCGKDKIQINSFVNCPPIKEAICRPKTDVEKLILLSVGRSSYVLAAIDKILTTHLNSEAYKDYAKWQGILKNNLTKD